MFQVISKEYLQNCTDTCNSSPFTIIYQIIDENVL